MKYVFFYFSDTIWEDREAQEEVIVQYHHLKTEDMVAKDLIMVEDNR